MSRWTLLLFALAPLTPACTSPRPSLTESMLERRAAQWERNHAARDEITQRWPTPITLEYGEHGTVYIDEVSLGGLLGHEYLHVHFSWVNTTDRRIDTVLLWLEISDPRGTGGQVQELELSLPLKLALLPNSSYTNWLDLDTEGLHMVPGWDWELRLDTIEADG